ncbi:unnamed protein product [Arabis nemorensis]|uniref:DUF4220 domain-containing protein n=1 Tax=Arabis nemorensis TaxID=586526 RepID=A0A565CFY2_9BRAS|nr:unnamed protein product [Arabis nemorensis]
MKLGVSKIFLQAGFKAVRDVWEKWNIRGLVIFSLVLQTFLVLLSPNRKRTPRILFRLLIWSSYLLANWAADYAVGQISDSSGDKPEPNESPKTNELLAFWATFLLLHLGGPDTITALALEDNELWLRSLFGLVCQFIATLYVFLLSIPNSLLVPTSLMLVAGVIKYVERISAMRGASLERFKDSMLGEPEPGIDYVRFMEEHKIRTISRERSQLVRVEEPEKEQEPVRPKVMSHLQVVQYAYKYFNVYKGLVVDFIYSSQKWRESKQFFQALSGEEALKILEVELSFMYGTLFTKTDILHTWIGAAFRCIALCCLFASLYIFKTSRKDGYDGFDVALTYALIFGGIALDLISILIFCLSDWTFARLRKPKEDVHKKDTWFDRFLNWLLGFRELKWKQCSCHERKERCHRVPDRHFIFRRWSECIYAYNLIDSSLRIKPKRIHHTKSYIHRFFDSIVRRLYIYHTVVIIIGVIDLTSTVLSDLRKKMNLYIISLLIKDPVKYYALYPVKLFLRFWFGIPLINYLLEFFGILDQVNEIVFTSHTCLTKELWEFIFEEVKHKSNLVIRLENASHIYSARGDWILLDMEIEGYYETLLPYVTEVDYDQSILVWHIATELLHQTEEAETNVRYKELSKTLSDYMMYLLIAQPSLMSTVAGIDKVRFRDAIAEAKNLQEVKKLFQRTHVEESREACEEILASYKEVEQRNENAKVYRSKSVLFQASMLANELRRIQIQEDDVEMWGVVSKVWVEMLCYGATHCDSKQHAAQINKGGELINFAWLLMAHFGLGEQFRNPKEDSRTRLILGKTTSSSCLVRYEKWNPVHPTYGAFWGMGIGIGCGVGWGPGFGPEVIGYVGAGCGVGFSVGITLAGLGIGLPTNLLLAAPYNTVEATRKGAFELFGKNLSIDGWSNFMPQIAGLQRQVKETCSGFNKKPLSNNDIDIRSLPLFISHDCGRFGSHLLHLRKEDKNHRDSSDM